MIALKPHPLVFVVLCSATVVFTWKLKNPYRFDLESVEVFRDPKYIMQVDYARIEKTNQTTYVFNMAANITQDFPDDLIYQLTMFELLATNAYSEVPMTIARGSFKKYFLTDSYFMPDFNGKSNYPRTWPMKKGYFQVENYLAQIRNLPPELPGERWRMEHVFTVEDVEVFRLHVCIFINRAV